ncbi:MAG: hypothetical protein M3Q16_07450 [Pseudomonadota bacterium]|nr:hypothetical protein [Pseudomonadota bacterium]
MKFVVAMITAGGIISVLMAGVVPADAHADTPQLRDRQTGKYLGNLSANPYDPNSTSNPYGQYGSKYSPDSINNPHGKYCSPYSNDSAANPYATNPPAIIDPK